MQWLRKFLKRSQPRQLLEWRGDWLYLLVFQEVEQNWQFCKRSSNKDYWQYVLVEEWSSADGSHCQGEILRAWIRDQHGLRQISLFAHSQHMGKISDRIYPFVLTSFYVFPDRSRIVFCHREANTAGSGMRYLLIGSGDKAKLEPDPSGSFWIS